MSAKEKLVVRPTVEKELRLSSLFAPGAVLSIPAHHKDELLRALAEVVIGKSPPAVVDRIYEAIQEREAAVNTYVGEGIAIPHARLDFVEGISLALARSAEGYPYGLEKDQRVHLVVLVVGNEALAEEHVRVLGAVARALKTEESRQRIIQAPDEAAVLKLLDASEGRAGRHKARSLSQLLLKYARRIGRERGADSILICLDTVEDLSLVRRVPGRKSFILATTSRRVAEEGDKVVGTVILLPQLRLPREARLRLATLMAVTQGHVSRGALLAILSGAESGGLDSLRFVEVGREIGKLVTASGELSSGLLPGVLERAITLAAELGAEGREGKPVGTIFAIGSPQSLGPFCQQMVMNPFRGYPEEERNILDPTLAETIKEFAAIDGAFVVRQDGVVQSAGTFLKVTGDVNLPGGYGSRHRAGCAVTSQTDCVAVVISQSTGEVTVFRKGAVLLHLPRGSAG